jgi:AcrR family transcriptional regulator
MTARKKKSSKTNVSARIVNEAVRLGEEQGWSRVRLSELADRLNVPLSDVLSHYRDANDIANAFFQRAASAMASAPNRRFKDMSPRDRIECLMQAWFDHLAPHRTLAVEMLQAKLWPFHPHHYVPMVFDLSRLIQLMRDIAGLKASGRQKQIEEIGLTSLFLATLAVWSRDESLYQDNTKHFLAQRLDRADQTMGRLFGTSAET